MGNLCGKEEADPFSTPGRRLDSATPPAVSTGPITSQPKRQVGGPTRTLGGGQLEAGNWGANADEARMKAAAAAEARAQSSKPAGKLASQLEAQKKQTRIENLKEASETQRRQREADVNAEALSHN